MKSDWLDCDAAVALGNFGPSMILGFVNAFVCKIATCIKRTGGGVADRTGLENRQHCRTHSELQADLDKITVCVKNSVSKRSPIIAVSVLGMVPIVTLVWRCCVELSFIQHELEQRETDAYEDRC